MSNLESRIGTQVREEAIRFGIKPPHKVVFCANYAAATYESGDPRSHNFLRKINASQMSGLAGEVLTQEVSEMFPNSPIDFRTIELNNVTPGSREWQELTTADLVFLSLATRNLSQGVLISKAFGKDKTLIVGGHHVTRNSNDFHQLTDEKVAVVKGRMEGILPAVLFAAKDGGHRGQTYTRKSKFDASLDYHHLPRKGVITRLTGPNANGVIVEAGVGCEGRCDFCAILTFAESDRNPDQLIEEIRRIHDQDVKYIMFADDNLSNRSPELLEKVFTVINGLGMGWIGEGSRNILQDIHLAKIVGRNNIGFLHGIEDEALSGHTKDKLRNFDQIKDDIQALLEAGFIVVGSAVLGLDNHTFPDTFIDYRNSIYRLQIPVAVHIATPYPGTAYSAKLRREDRIFDNNPAHYDNGNLVFRPAQMTEDQFIQGIRWLQRELGSPENAVKVINHVTRTVGIDKFRRVPRAIPALIWLSLDQGLNGTNTQTPERLKPYSISLLNAAWDNIIKQ